MKRIVLLLATNFAVLLLLGIVMQVFGIDEWLARRGTQYESLLIFAAIFGFGGSFFSLAISKWVAKRAMGVQVIERPTSEAEQWLLATVREHAQRVGVRMPEVGIFDSPEPNAFATGATRNSALVAVSTGLLRNMRRDEVAAVLGHEVAHVANGDMVTLTLLQGVLNTFVIFLSRVIGGVIDSFLRSDEDEGQGAGFGYFAIVMVLQLVFGFLATMIVAWFSRQREFRADAGGADLAGTRSMIGALDALKRVHSPSRLPESMAAFGINGHRAQALMRLLMSHPPLDERIAALEQRPAALGRAS